MKMYCQAVLKHSSKEIWNPTCDILDDNEENLNTKGHNDYLKMLCKNEYWFMPHCSFMVYKI